MGAGLSGGRDMGSDDVLTVLVVLAGVLTLVLGATHFVYPALFSYRQIFDAYPGPDHGLRPFQLWILSYPMDTRKAYGIIWMMNHHVSLVLVSIGLLELTSPGWLLRSPYLALWIAAWWLLRAICQPLLLGRRWYDWLITTGFSLLSVGHAWIGLSGLFA